MKPTDELYQSLLEAYGHFNETLFGGRLPEVIFTVQRQKGVLGYFAPDRWSSLEGRRCHEIAINPAHLGDSRLIEVLQTLVHEMVHCWQHCFGSAGRGSYHNREWANKMIEVGLQPSSTGLPGGRMVGQTMSDYPVAGGRFLQACETLILNRSFTIPWVDRQSAPKSWVYENSAEAALEAIRHHAFAAEDDRDDDPAEPLSADPDGDVAHTVSELMQMTFAQLLPEDAFLPAPQKVRAKTKYQCPGCYNRVWGKPAMHIVCGDCEVPFQAVG